MLLLGAGLLLVQLGLRAWAAGSSWFFQDDFLLAAQASRGLSADFLLQEYSGHLMPAGLLMVWLVTWAAPLQWGPPLALMLLLQLATGLVLLRTVLLLLRQRIAALAPVALFALTPLTLNSVLWWGSGLQALPHQLAVVVAVDGHLRWLRGHRRRHAVQSLLGVAGGLLFYEKVLLVPLLLVLLSVLPLARERGWRRLTALRDQRAYWGAQGLLAAAYAVLYLALTGGPDGRRSPPGDWWTVTVEAVRTVTTALVGGPWRVVGDMPVAAHLAPPEGVAAAVGVAVAAFVGWTVLRGGRRALEAWLVLVAYLALDIGLLVSARGPLAPFLASDPRYYADAAPVAALALALALRAVQDRDVARTPRTSTSRPRAAAALAAMALVAGGSVVTTVALGQQAERYSARHYVDRLREALQGGPGRRARRQPRGARRHRRGLPRRAGIGVAGPGSAARGRPDDPSRATAPRLRPQRAPGDRLPARPRLRPSRSRRGLRLPRSPTSRAPSRWPSSRGRTTGTSRSAGSPAPPGRGSSPSPVAATRSCSRRACTTGGCPCTGGSTGWSCRLRPTRTRCA